MYVNRNSIPDGLHMLIILQQSLEALEGVEALEFVWCQGSKLLEICRVS